MGLLEFYIIFAATTATAAVYELWWPIFTDLKKLSPTNPVVNHWILALFTYWIMAFITAPILFFACVIPGLGNRYKDRLILTLLK